ncbi:acetate/propionate family kinase [Sulfitobacter sp. CW3]|uniref:acetate/propionate family kinase n=1 Tax=Sulfitobacter sp. CW3 TaxID=2861965 RepID=UPI001C5EE73E|nr:acetate/propionate family kinase [Sulfitobacter sp. CW3]MBW4963831.1 acetate/propionate family kinase [Sulfitobacter sp. CW3]
MPERVILTLNSGSSSLKFALFTASLQPKRLWSGEIDRIGLTGGHFQLSDARSTVVVDESGRLDSHEAALTRLLMAIASLPGSLDLVAVGHRVVHGGPECDCPKDVTPALLARLRRLAHLAPLHMPPNLAGIDAVLATRPEVPQVACFDTSFHHDLPSLARMTALPRAYAKDGIRRYGFHGLSYEYIMEALRDDGVDVDAERIIVAHLGNGASMAAIRNGNPVETSMGFSTIAGLPMGTRTGDVDPGILLFLMQEKGMSSDEMATLLYEQSGLLGMSGLSRNMEDLLDSPKEAAAETVAYFCYQARLHLARLTGALGGLDRVVFTGGIGENSDEIRSRICVGLGYLGVNIDSVANKSGWTKISKPDSRVIVEARATDEEKMIARHVAVKFLAKPMPQASEVEA